MSWFKRASRLSGAQLRLVVYLHPEQRSRQDSNEALQMASVRPLRSH